MLPILALTVLLLFTTPLVRTEWTQPIALEDDDSFGMSTGIAALPTATVLACFSHWFLAAFPTSTPPTASGSTTPLSSPSMLSTRKEAAHRARSCRSRTRSSPSAPAPGLPVCQICSVTMTITAGATRCCLKNPPMGAAPGPSMCSSRGKMLPTSSIVAEPPLSASRRRTASTCSIRRRTRTGTLQSAT